MVKTRDFLEKTSSLLSIVKGKNTTTKELSEKTIDLAALILKEAQQIQTKEEKAQQELLARMMKDPSGKIFTTYLTDQCFRTRNSRRIADQLCYLLKKFGSPKFPPFKTRLGMKAFPFVGKLFSPLLIPVIKKMLRKEMANVILPGESSTLTKHIQKRHKEGVRVNLNHLGEAILGEDDAQKRLQTYLDDLARPDVEYISIKISTIYSQLNLIGWDATIAQLAVRLRQLYRAAANHSFTKPDGSKTAKFVNLDMEEYRDLHLTVELFCKVLSEPEFLHHSAGIVLQSYLPDSFLVQQQITQWALERTANGGAPIKIRIVKGANLAMEQVEAALKNWPQAPYETKEEVDANYLRMVDYGCAQNRPKAVHLGIASHNLFDIAYGLLLRSQYNVEPFVGFEMLEGMADHMRRAVQKVSSDMLLYCPVAKKEEFQNAVAYLIRRLDENTAPDNFLRALFNMRADSTEWKQQVQLFQKSMQRLESLKAEPRRGQNRAEAPAEPNPFAPFENEPDTDWSLPQNVQWGRSIIKEWEANPLTSIPLTIAGESRKGERGEGIGRDPSHPEKPLFRYALAGSKDIEDALQSAENAFSTWTCLPSPERSLLMAKIAQKMREQRGRLMGAMLTNTGKTLYEADVEISEAIDFAEYYRRNIEELHCLEGIEWKAKGTILVTPPWNFPCSIPAGGILAALATGNCVLFKPAEEAILVGAILAEIFWEAGVSKQVLQFLACEDDPIGSALIRDPRVTAVILTGATATAKLFLKMRPGIDLLAETGGKNSLIVTNLSDRDLAVKDLISSAFGHSGQKCSACSLAILEAEVYDDPQFRRQLKDAAQSLKVDSPWNLSAKVTPLIHAPEKSSALYRALTELEPGEEWLLKPAEDAENPHLWSPGIKLGVQPNSFTHLTEFFGPVLGVMRANSLIHAIELANGTSYGLTAGIHTLDEREIKKWEKEIVAGNCYVNRGITGAIVQRQPFGGCKESSFGAGMKAGGPNYLMNLMHAKERELPKEKASLGSFVQKICDFSHEKNFTAQQHERLLAGCRNYAYYWDCYFSKDHDPSCLLGEDNILRYRALDSLILRTTDDDDPVELLLAIAAAATVNCPLEISCNEKQNSTFLEPLLNLETPFTVAVENEEQFAARLNPRQHIRMLSAPKTTLQKAFAIQAANVRIVPAVSNGRVELTRFLREISLSIIYHRYGNLGDREKEKRHSLPKG